MQGSVGRTLHNPGVVQRWGGQRGHEEEGHGDEDREGDVAEAVEAAAVQRQQTEDGEHRHPPAADEQVAA